MKQEVKILQKLTDFLFFLFYCDPLTIESVRMALLKLFLGPTFDNWATFNSNSAILFFNIVFSSVFSFNF